MLRPLLLVAASGMAGCGSGAPQETSPVALVELRPSAARTLDETLTAYGTTEFAPADAATLAVQVESQVSELLVTRGDQVRRGQPLLRLAPSRATGLELGKARRDADLAIAERARMQRLRSEGLATEDDLQAAVNAAASATALRDSLGARTDGDGVQTLDAPRDGIVDVLDVKPGEVLAPGSIAVRIAAADSLQVRVGVEPAQASRVAVGQSVRLEALAGHRAPVSAAVTTVDRRVDPQDRLIAALVRLPPGSGLLPGEGVRAQIRIGKHKDAVAVPRAALLYAGERAYLFVAIDGKAQRREVRAGIRDGDAVEIINGVKPGERVIVTGNSVLEDGMAIRTQAQEGNPRPAATGAKANP
jgi:RND family efflux transporter MFP subunit